MEELAKLPKDMVFYTQMTMEAGEDGVIWIDRKANIKGRWWREGDSGGMKAVSKDWNYSRGAASSYRHQSAWSACVGSFILGLPLLPPLCYVEMGIKPRDVCAFVMMTHFGHGGFCALGKEQAQNPTRWRRAITRTG